MATTRSHTPLRNLVLGLATIGTALGVASSGAYATPVQPAPPKPPTVASVTQRLTVLGEQEEALAEKFNLARADLKAKQQHALAAAQAAKKAAAEFALARAQFRALVTAQYEGAKFSSTGALLTSENGQNYLDQISQLNLMASHRGDIVTQLNTAKAKSDSAQQAADNAVEDAKATLDAVNAQHTGIEAQKKKFKSLLATLTAEQRRAFAARNAVPIATARAAIQVPLTAHAGSAAAQKAVDFALAQVGKPYVYAASGPDAYDCSGLTMAAWAAAGVQLPHNAEAQYSYGTQVSLDALQPGDLVFMYSPIGHVEIYIGNGLAVSAPQEGESVKVITAANPENVGATRLT
ncbi:MAG: C40 family peptidase [Actinomycetota bacterium]